MNNYAFIDSHNVYLSIKSLGWSINWKRFRVYLKEHYGVLRPLFFVYVEGNNGLYSELQEAGFICVFKPVLKYKDGKVKGNVDAEGFLYTKEGHMEESKGEPHEEDKNLLPPETLTIKYFLQINQFCFNNIPGYTFPL